MRADDVDVAEAARMLDVSPRRVRQLIHDGLLPARRVGKSWLVDAEAAARRARFDRSPGRPVSMSKAWIDGAALEAPWVHLLGESEHGSVDMAREADDSAFRYRLHALLADLDPEDLLHDVDRRRDLRRVLHDIDRQNRVRDMAGQLAGHLADLSIALDARDRDRLVDNARIWAEWHAGGSFEGHLPSPDRAPVVYRNRSRRRLRLRAHPGVLLDLSHRVVLSGARAGALLGADLVPDRNLEGYVLHGPVDAVAEEFALQPVDDPHAANVLLHDSVDDWPAHHSSPPQGVVAPRLLVACDLLESLDPRAQRAGGELLGLVSAAHQLSSLEGGDLPGRAG